MLELNEPIESLEMAKLVYKGDGNNEDGHDEENKGGNLVGTILSDQRKATARLYACEAFCKIGNPRKAYEAIFGPYDDDEIEDDDNESEYPDSMNMLKKLAYDLACTSADTDEENEDVPSTEETPEHMMKPPILNQAISCLRVSLSGLHASLDNVDAAERNARCALKNLESIEDTTLDVSGTIRSVKKALLYCYLFKGDTDNAMQLLHTLI